MAAGLELVPSRQKELNQAESRARGSSLSSKVNRLRCFRMCTGATCG